MSKKLKKKDKALAELESIKAEIRELERQRDFFWDGVFDSLQTSQMWLVRTLDESIDGAIKSLESTKKNIKENGISGYFSSHHDVFSKITRVYSTSHQLADLKRFETRLKDFKKKNAKKNSSSNTDSK